MAKRMCTRAVSKEHFILKHCLDKYETLDMCDKLVYTFLPTIKFVPD